MNLKIINKTICHNMTKQKHCDTESLDQCRQYHHCHEEKNGGSTFFSFFFRGVAIISQGGSKLKFIYFVGSFFWRGANNFFWWVVQFFFWRGQHLFGGGVRYILILDRSGKKNLRGRTKERAGTNHVTSGPMRGLKTQWHKHTSRRTWPLFD